jgi:hypothetical protein
MSNSAHSHTSNEERQTPPHTPSVPSTPRDSVTLVVEVTPPPTLAAFPLTLITDYEQDSLPENNGPLTGLIDLVRSEYPAVSPTSAETILALDPMLNATIRATAFGLATTVRERTAQYAAKLAEADQKIL